MIFTSISSFFFPPAHRDALPVSTAKRVAPLIAVDSILFFFFQAAGLMRFRAYPETYTAFYVAVFATSLAYPVSLILLRSKKYKPASYIGSFATLLNVCWVGLFVPTTVEGDLYRFSLYVVVAVIANLVVSLSMVQIYVFAIANVLAFLGYYLIILVPHFGFGNQELHSLVPTMALLVLFINLIIYIIARVNGDLLASSEMEVKAHEERSRSLAEILERARDTFRVGEDLGIAAHGGTQEADVAASILQQVKRETDELAANAARSLQTYVRIDEFSRGAHEAAQRQGTAVRSTGVAVEQMESTIQSLATIATERQRAMETVVSRIDAQDRDARSVVHEIAQIRESSKNVLSSLATILDLSERTGILAMNASIEAARAGNSGKGFSIIAGEVRTLAEEIKRGTQTIADAMGENQSAIDSTASVVERFAIDSKGTMTDARHTFDSIVELIRGLDEMRSAIRELAASSQAMGESTLLAEESVKNTSSQVSAGKTDAEDIGRSANMLKASVDEMSRRYRAINAALERIAAIGEQNLQDVTELKASLESLS